MQFPEDFEKLEALSPSFGKVKDDSCFWTSWIKTAIHNINHLSSDYPNPEEWDDVYSIGWGGLNYVLDKELQTMDSDTLPDFAKQVMGWLPTSKDQMILNYKVMSRAMELQPNEPVIEGTVNFLNEQFSLEDGISERLGAFRQVSSCPIFEDNLEAMASAFLKLPSVAFPGASSIEVEIEKKSLKDF